MRTRSALLVAVILIAILTSAAYYYTYPRNISKSMPQHELYNITMAVSQEVEEIRNLTFKEQPQIIIVNRSWAVQEWRSSPANLEEAKMWEEIYKLTLFAPPTYNYTKTQEAVKASWIAATSGNKMYIIEENFKETGDTAYRVIAHELTHILQKHYFDPSYPSTLDGRLAITALIEGDADLTADIYCIKHNITIHKIRSLPLDDPPMALGYFPYVYGDKFVEFLYNTGGWELVNEAYNKPPLSTEQIMHPKKYLIYEKPKKVSITIAKGYQIIHRDTMGEFYVYLLIGTHLGADEASSVAEGWEGDTLVFLKNSTHEAVIWKTLWESEKDAREFYGAMRAIIEKTKKEYPTFNITTKLQINGSEVLFASTKKI